MSPPHLALVWNQGTVVTRKSKSTPSPPAAPSVSSAPQRAASAWTAPNVILGFIGLLIAAGVIRGIYYLGSLDERVTNNTNAISEIKNDFKSFSEKTTEILQEIKTQLGRLEERITNLELRDKATAAGFTDPNIVPVRLSQPSPRLFNKPDEKISYDLTFTLQAITKDTIRFSLDGTIGGIHLKDVVSIRAFHIGVPLNLMSALRLPIPQSSNALSVWLVILAIPTPDTAIIAIGPKTPSPATPIG